ncbi:hypothetical protein H8356DRAFT_1347338 [Neocallimastix lanati (nom. inval.)]|nr:hypothetical protein H8356DRAFT_1347338 [Neocallimastix sp. JGI-2020a]
MEEGASTSVTDFENKCGFFEEESSSHRCIYEPTQYGSFLITNSMKFRNFKKTFSWIHLLILLVELITMSQNKYKLNNQPPNNDERMDELIVVGIGKEEGKLPVVIIVATKYCRDEKYWLVLPKTKRNINSNNNNIMDTYISNNNALYHITSEGRAIPTIIIINNNNNMDNCINDNKNNMEQNKLNTLKIDGINDLNHQVLSNAEERLKCEVINTQFKSTLSTYLEVIAISNDDLEPLKLRTIHFKKLIYPSYSPWSLMQSLFYSRKKKFEGEVWKYDGDLPNYQIIKNFWGKKLKLDCSKDIN